MTYEEKLDIVVEAIREAKKFTRKDCLTKLYWGNGNGLSRVGLDATYEILLQLQDDEKVIKVAKNTSSKGNFDQTVDIQNGAKNYFMVDVLDDTFENWYINYKIKQKGKIENLSDANFKEVYFVLGQIEDQLQLNQSGKFNFSFVSSVHDIQGYESEDIDDLTNGYIKVLEYLKKIDVIKDYSHGVMSLDADISLNVARFLEILDTAKKVKQNRQQEEPVKPTTPAIDKIRVIYDAKKGLLSVGDKTVKLNKDSFRAKLIELLLKDDESRKYEWSWDEVIETIEDTKDTELTKESKNKFYPACDGLTKHIASKIGINDLLIFNKSTVQVNPKYL